VVLEGIKEGMQGMGRLIIAGLGSIGHVDIAEGNISVSSSIGILSPTFSRRRSANFPVPLCLGTGNSYGHESQSSSSTTAPVTTIASSSTSATSFILEEGTAQNLSPLFTSTVDDEVAKEYGDFPTRSLEELEEHTKQVLMVHDTGATPMTGPNPHLQRSRTKVEQKDPSGETSGSDILWDSHDRWTTSGALTEVDDSMDYFTNSALQARTPSSSSSSAPHTVQPVCMTNPPKIEPATLPGVSSAPCLASSSCLPMNGTTPQSMSAWVGTSVGKMWGEIWERQTLLFSYFFSFFLSFLRV